MRTPFADLSVRQDRFGRESQFGLLLLHIPDLRPTETNAWPPRDFFPRPSHPHKEARSGSGNSDRPYWQPVETTSKPLQNPSAAGPLILVLQHQQLICLRLLRETKPRLGVMLLVDSPEPVSSLQLVGSCQEQLYQMQRARFVNGVYRYTQLHQRAIIGR